MLYLEIQKHYPDMKVIKSNLWDYITRRYYPMSDFNLIQKSNLES